MIPSTKQVQLEKIRQSEKELRWQYEDDVDNCSECRQLFNVTKRKVSIPRTCNYRKGMELIGFFSTSSITVDTAAKYFVGIACERRSSAGPTSDSPAFVTCAIIY